jgi:hypothetical protein
MAVISRRRRTVPAAVPAVAAGILHLHHALGLGVKGWLFQ